MTLVASGVTSNFVAVNLSCCLLPLLLVTSLEYQRCPTSIPDDAMPERNLSAEHSRLVEPNCPERRQLVDSSVTGTCLGIIMIPSETPHNFRTTISATTVLTMKTVFGALSA